MTTGSFSQAWVCVLWELPSHSISHQLSGWTTASTSWLWMIILSPCHTVCILNDLISVSFLRAYILWEGKQVLGFLTLSGEESRRSLLFPARPCLCKTQYNGIWQPHVTKKHRQGKAVAKNLTQKEDTVKNLGWYEHIKREVGSAKTPCEARSSSVSLYSSNLFSDIWRWQYWFSRECWATRIKSENMWVELFHMSLWITGFF